MHWILIAKVFSFFQSFTVSCVKFFTSDSNKKPYFYVSARPMEHYHKKS